MFYSPFILCYYLFSDCTNIYYYFLNLCFTETNAVVVFLPLDIDPNWLVPGADISPPKINVVDSINSTVYPRIGLITAAAIIPEIPKAMGGTPVKATTSKKARVAKAMLIPGTLAAGLLDASLGHTTITPVKAMRLLWQCVKDVSLFPATTKTVELDAKGHGGP